MARLENRLKKYLVKIMGTRWDVQSHEDSLSLGIPDLSYGARGVSGWIELKQRKAWPVKPETPVKFDHFTANQVNWLRSRGKKAGHCYILAKISTEYFLFSFHDARILRAGITQEEYRKKGLASWSGQIEPSELLEAIAWTNWSI